MEINMVNFNDVKNITSKEYLKGEEFASDMFDAKYAHVKTDGSKETPAEVFYRIATELSEFEKTENRETYKNIWFSLLWDGWFRPGGSVISGVGSTIKQSLGNCTTVGLNGDSLEDIADTDYKIMKCAAFRQGLGVDCSNLRPKGAKVNNSAIYSTGAVPWMEKLVDNGKYVGQRGRMPALLVSLKDRHPDIFEFITAKIENGKLENANISVQISNDFMNAVESDSDWELYFEFPNEKYEKISKIVKAREIFKLIAKTAWSSAEPGVQYIDLLRSGTLCHQIYKATGDERFKILSTNACVPGFSSILTTNGIKKMDNINIGDIIWSGKEWTKVINKWSNGIKPVYEYNTSSSRFIGTQDHNVYDSGKKLEIGNAKKLDVCKNECNNTVLFDNQSILDGLLIGDGGIHKASNNLILLYIGKDDGDYFKSEIASLIGKERKGISKYAWEVVSTSLNSDDFTKTYNRIVPNKFYYGDFNIVCSFLRGLFSANGTVSTSGNRVSLKQTSLKMIYQVREMLSSVGIFSYITTNKSKKITFNNGEYISKESYDLNICSDIDIFQKNIGFIQQYKNEKLNNILKLRKNKKNNKSIDIKTKKYLGEFEVFDITVDNEDHTFWCNGSLVSNCSEKPLANLNVCNLLSINMEKFSSDPTKYLKELEEIIPYLVRMSDNVISYELKNNLTPLKEQEWIVSNTREIGMGITNIHGWLLKQNLRYASSEGNDKIEHFWMNYAHQVFKSSIELGKEKGNAPAFELIEDKSIFMNSIFFNNIVNEYFGGDYNKITHLRNLAFMSIAPSGSISNTFPEPVFSSGIEPVIAPWYWRKTRAINKGIYTHYFVIPHKVKQYVIDKIDNEEDREKLLKFPGSVLDETGEIGNELIKIISKYVDKDLFSPAHLINYTEKINLMSKIYKWTDASISVTYNLPNSSTWEDVYKIYIDAFKNGVRAVSVYVDGSREGVLIFEDPVTNAKKYSNKQHTPICNDNNRPVDIVLTCAPKRPKELTCDIHFTNIKGVNWIVLIGLLNNNPFEVFCGKSEELSIPKSCKTGIIIKEKTGQYMLRISNKNINFEYSNIADVLMTDNEKSITRILSLSLRHGVSPLFVVQQLKKSGGDITAFSTAISRVLSKYINSYTFKDNEKECPECKEKSLMFIEGCIKCSTPGCLYSRCG